VGKPRRVLIEGSVMLVCSECSRLGSVLPEPKPQPSRIVQKLARGRVKPTIVRVKSKLRKPMDEQEFDLVEGYGLVVKRARERLNLSHEDLGRMIGEKVSVLKKVEGEKIFPDRRLIAKLEHALKVKLTVPAEEPKIPKSFQATRPIEPTLGEVAQLKFRKRRS